MGIRKYKKKNYARFWILNPNYEGFTEKIQIYRCKYGKMEVRNETFKPLQNIVKLIQFISRFVKNLFLVNAEQ